MVASPRPPVFLRGRSTRVMDRLPAGPTRVDVLDRLSREWFDGWLAVHGPGDPQAEWDVLARVEQPCGYARTWIGDEVVAVGGVVVDTGWAGVFGSATLARARRRSARTTTGTPERRDRWTSSTLLSCRRDP